MSAHSILVVLFAALLGSHAFASEQVLKDCSAAAPEAVGLEELEESCPGVGAALSESGYSAFIDAEQLELLTPASLGDLLRLRGRYQEDAKPPATLDRVMLDSVLSGLEVPPPRVAAKGMLESLRDWLRKYFSKNLESDNWLSRWLKDLEISKVNDTWLLTALALLIVGAAIAVIAIELRASGLFLRSTRIAASGAVQAEPVTELSLADLETTAVRDRAAMLFKILVAALHRSGRLGAEQALTHRELGGRASFDDEQQRASFGAIATLAEGSLYGGHVVAADELERAIASGRSLYPRLSSPTAPNLGGQRT